MSTETTEPALTTHVFEEGSYVPLAEYEFPLLFNKMFMLFPFLYKYLPSRNI